MTVTSRNAAGDHTVTRVGVVGIGQMGSGIPQVYAVAGFDVCVGDVSAELIDRSVLKINDNLQR